MTDNTAALLALIEDGAALENKSAALIEDVIGYCEAASTAVAALDPLPARLSEPNQDAMVAILDDLGETLGDFLVHTNRVSGVTYDTDGAGTSPDFLALVSVAGTLAFIENLENPEDESTVMEDFFGSLTSHQDDLERLAALTITLVADISDIVNKPNWDADDVIAELEVLEALFLPTMEAEADRYSAGIGKIRQWALAQTLNSPTATWRSYLIDNILTEDAAALVPEVDAGAYDSSDFNPFDEE